MITLSGLPDDGHWSIAGSMLSLGELAVRMMAEIKALSLELGKICRSIEEYRRAWHEHSKKDDP
jgi:hypothetical protein